MNYTVTDLAQFCLGLVLFVPFGLSPGYVLGRLSNVLGFRSKSMFERVLIGLVVSTSTVPILLYLTGRFGSTKFALSLVGLLFAAFVVLIVKDLRKKIEVEVDWRPFVWIGLVWLLVMAAVTVDFQWGDRLYIAASSFDYAVRSEVVASIARNGVTPPNPFFHPGSDVPLRYHYLWFLACAFVNVISGNTVSPGATIMAGTAWCGLSLMACILLWVWRFGSKRAFLSRKRALVGLGLLVVTGLDIIPVLFAIPHGFMSFTVDKWNEDLCGWMGSLFWAPHYIAAMTSCFTGFLVLWSVFRSKQESIPWKSMLLCGAALASAAGSGIYIAFVFGIALIVLMCVYLWKGWYRYAYLIAGSGLIAAAMASPYLLSLFSPGTGGSNQGAPIEFAVRKFTYFTALFMVFGLEGPMIALGNFLLLPLNYAFELGIFFFAGAITIRRMLRRPKPFTEADWAQVTFIVVPVVICSLFRSGVISNNDLGWRGFLIAQFVLLLWAIDFARVGKRRAVPSKRKGQRIVPVEKLANILVLCIWVGIASTVYDVGINRLFLWTIDSGVNPSRSWLFPDRNFGKRTLALRNAHAWIDEHVSTSGVLMHYPAFEDVFAGLYGKRQIVAFDQACGTQFGGQFEDCKRVLTDLGPLFEDARTTERQVGETCRKYSADVVIVKDLDPIWREKSSWVWRAQPVYANELSRVFDVRALAADRRQ